jgi:GDP/UDP-N,N'-diacetylbacillosamine 2-epimerase (hydrolysing)
MKVVVLTSSRADYSIYLPLLKAMQADPFFETEIIVFGTHIAKEYGETVREIIKDGFVISAKIDTLPDGDSPYNIASSMGMTMTRFSKVWRDHPADLILALGDRYEMFAACFAALPYGGKIAHIHGGESTMGAMDEVFRHSITHVAQIHFATTQAYMDKIIQLKGSSKNVYNVGALSIDNLKSLELFDISQIKERFSIDLAIPTILITFHPETIAFEKNEYYIDQLISSLNEIQGYQFLFTMPNSDTMGTIIRRKISDFVSNTAHAVSVESLGTIGYLSCMKHCAFLLGNTSSGFVEAAFFMKYVINLGERQTGRIVTSNICNCNINKQEIIKAISSFNEIELPAAIDIYGNGTAAAQIVSILKNMQ